MVTKERFARYRQKLNFVVGKVAQIPKTINTYLEKDATFYRMQTAIDACMDIVAMLVKDEGHDVGDDYTNIHTLQSENILDKKLADDVTRLNGLRNALVHKYNSFEEEAVTENIGSIKRILVKFMEAVEDELKTFNRKN